MLVEDVKKIASIIDVAALGAATQKKDVEEMVRVASAIGFASTCVNPCYVKYVSAIIPKGYTKNGAVIGYPFGQQTKETKINEARQALEDGAEELDMVTNVGCFKDGRDSYIADEISSIVEAAGGKIVKVIIESCCLDQGELVRMAKLVETAGAHYIKTSSGFNVKGGTIEECKLLHDTVGGKIGVKISGLGADFTFDQAVEFVNVGVTRIGARLNCPLVDTIRKNCE